MRGEGSSARRKNRPGTADAFPRWLMRLDPSLVRARRSPLFQIFHQHRRERPVGAMEGLRWLLRAITLLSSGVVATAYGTLLVISLLVGVMFLASSVFAFTLQGVIVGAVCLVIGVAAIASSVGMAVLDLPGRLKRAQLTLLEAPSNAMPRSVSQIIVMGDLPPQLAEDLYLTGVRGHDIAEAVLLEVCETTFRRLRIAFALLALPVALTVVLSAPHVTVFTVMNVPVSLAALAMLYLALFKQEGWDHLLSLPRLWRGQDAAGTASLWGSHLLIRTATILALPAVPCVLIFTIGAFTSLMLGRDPVVAMLWNDGVVLTLMLFLSAVAYFAGVRGGRGRPTREWRAEIDQAWSAFIERRALGEEAKAPPVSSAG